MEFDRQLNEIIERIGCLNKDLAEASHLSEVAISRYRNGVRAPKADSITLQQLAHGLAVLSENRGCGLAEDVITIKLQNSLSAVSSYDADQFIDKMKELLNGLDITIKELADSVGYDPSYLSRILRKERKPRKLEKLIALISAFFSSPDMPREKKEKICAIIGIDKSLSENDEELKTSVFTYLCSSIDVVFPDVDMTNTPITGFLHKLDDFDLDDFIKAIRFDDVKLPTVPFQIPKTESYSGIEQMKKSELDFMKTVVLSRSKSSVILYSDMPITEMAKDTEFSKKYMYGLAMMIKKGLHINFIHDVNRPFNEMMIGLESNIPLYMTGQISPFYLKNSESRVFNHLLKVSGSAALCGEAIKGNHNSGRYILTTKRDDVFYYRTRAKQLLEHASELMEIFREDRKEIFLAYLDRSFTAQCERKMIFSCLPLFTISEQLLDKLLCDNNVSKENAETIRKHRAYIKEKLEELLKNERVTIVVPKLTADDLSENAPYLFIPELFLDFGLKYSSDNYNAHLEQTKEFVSLYDNAALDISDTVTFKNIDFTIIKGKEVIVSKSKSPTIHFIIKHPRMVKSFENYSVPIIIN